MTSRRALLLSGSIGKGHDVVAEACQVTLAGHGVESRIVDSMRLLGSAGAPAGDWVFRQILGIPPLYDAFHFSQLRVGGRVARFLDSAALRTMYPRFLQEVEAFSPALIVAVFATGAAAAGRLKAERPELVTAVVCTDAFAHRMWVHEGIDVFVVTSRTGAAAIRRYLPRANVAVVEAPVRPPFYEAPSRKAARANLGVPGEARCVLLMSGAWGIGPLDSAAAALAAAGCHVLAVAGDNQPLAQRLRSLAAEQPRVLAFGYTDRVPELMAACDVVVTSSGDTCREARVIGRGLVLLDVVPGHGRENLMHELELGNAAVCSPDAASVAASVEAFLDAPDREEPPPVTSAANWERQFTEALASAGFGAN